MERESASYAVANVENSRGGPIGGGFPSELWLQSHKSRTTKESWQLNLHKKIQKIYNQTADYVKSRSLKENKTKRGRRQQELDDTFLLPNQLRNLQMALPAVAVSLARVFLRPRKCVLFIIGRQTASRKKFTQAHVHVHIFHPNPKRMRERKSSDDLIFLWNKHSCMPTHAWILTKRFRFVQLGFRQVCCRGFASCFVNSRHLQLHSDQSWPRFFRTFPISFAPI